MLPFTKQDLTNAIENGRVTARPHPTLPLTIYNYSPEVQYSNHWDDVTLNCRGLILDADFNVVARPWKKFFNLGQVNLPMQFDDPVEVMDKADGSLGILYPAGKMFGRGWSKDPMQYAIATRGSFASEQAQHATQIWEEKYHNLDPLTGYTMLFEIIAPWNRIVLDYKDMDDLILLGAVENKTGYYLGPNEARFLWKSRGGTFRHDRLAEWPGPVVEVFQYKTISEAMGYMERPNAEGYVIRSHNFLVKLKQPDYLTLHRLVTNASPKTVWDQLRQGKSKSEIVSAFPDEFHDYIGGMIDPLLDAFVRRCNEIFEGYSSLVERPALREAMNGTNYRKAFAAEAKKSQDARYYFLMLDGRPIRELLWTELKPKETALKSATQEE